MEQMQVTAVGENEHAQFLALPVFQTAFQAISGFNFWLKSSVRFWALAESEAVIGAFTPGLVESKLLDHRMYEWWYGVSFEGQKSYIQGTW